jgi:hypothetical protein
VRGSEFAATSAVPSLVTDGVARSSSVADATNAKNSDSTRCVGLASFLSARALASEWYLRRATNGNVK